jgi:alanine dehydrogenase
MAGELLYLGRSDVRNLLPRAEIQLSLVERTYRAMAAGTVQLPPKPAIHPRDDSFIHAMPAYLADEDIAAIKWVGGSARNKLRGLPYISGVIVVNDPETAAPCAIMDAAEITAARTAAVSALCVNRFSEADWRTVAIVGFGEQGQAHGRLLTELNPDIRLLAYTPRPMPVPGLDVVFVPEAGQATRGAEIVVTAIPLGNPPEPFISPDGLGDRWLLLPIDFDAAVHVSAVEESDLFVVDDIGQFEHYRSLGHFTGWPQPHSSLGDALASHARASRTVCCNLGVASLDAAFAAAVLAQAHEQGAGLLLPG